MSAGKLENLSAGEINKYVYCPLQWYYTRVYGEAELRARYRELHPERHGENPHFRRGRDFHGKYAKREAARRVWRGLLAAAALIVCVLVCYYVFRQRG
ncbi:MAG: hypothetical protein FWE91_02245 [Defluviitaleaceae bacterium]|nr:hypothetical protein [Defluviitaleaceae bacterium]MCL2835127.1 hypothetical protein [Defluviitaleaceae bacterium]